MTLPFLARPHRVLDGPLDVGVEQRWRVEFDDGSLGVVGQLAPDLARDQSIRRRYVRDVERVRQLRAHALVETLELGPEPDPRDPSTTAPWRLRAAPAGDSLDSVLARAPLGLEEFAALFAGLADAVHAVHRTGAVLRDLRPEQVLRTSEGRVVLADVGLARVDVLSSHTASSLLLQGSPYAAPEQLFRTTIDQRSDVYSLGALMWHGLTGALPFDDGPALLRERPPLPDLRTVRGDVTEPLATVVRDALEADPDRRPASVSEIAWVLRGGASPALQRETVQCQHCGAPLRLGQRLCLACGRIAVRFEHEPHTRGWGLDLVSLSEDARPLKWLQEFLHNVSRRPIRQPEFIIGNVHLYDDAEKAGRIRLPARLYSHLTQDTALALHEKLHAEGLKVRLVAPNAVARSGLELLVAAVGIVMLSFALHFVGIHAAWAAVPGGALCVYLLGRLNNRVTDKRTPGVFHLRDAPAALPASDPFVARLAALLQAKPPADVRGVLSELALLAQRLVDHRATLLGTQAAELAMVTQPIDALVSAVERHVARLVTLSNEFAELDEGAMVRALAASEARGDAPSQREPILAGLDRLRTLEDQRAQVFHRLLEVQALLRRTVEMGLAVQDAAAQHERGIQLALAALD